MFGPVLALLIRSLRSDLRTWNTAGWRLAFVASSVLFVFTVQTTGFAFGAPGLAYFSRLFEMALFLVFMLGAGHFSRPIAEEKEQLTLGLLRMTGISPLALLLGKSTSQLLQGLLLLTLQLPFMLLAVTLGGVTVVQVVAAYATTVAFMVLVANLALFCSVLCWTTQSAARMTGALLFAAFLLSQVGVANRNWVPGGLLPADGLLATIAVTVLDALALMSPVTSYIAITATGFTGPVVSPQVVGNLVVGVVLLLISWWSFDFLTRYESVPGPVRGMPKRRQHRLGRMSPGRAWTAALAWKDFYFLAGGQGFLLAQFVLYALLIGGLHLFINATGTGQSNSAEMLGNIAMISMLIAMLLIGYGLAARLLQDEIKWNTLDSLLLLPITPVQLIYGKATGCLNALVPAATYFLLGAALNPRLVSEVLEEPIALIGILFLTVDYLLLLCLTVYLSTFGKWGAGAAFAGMWLAHSCCGFGLLGPGPSATFLALLSIVGVVGIVMLHQLIGLRLRDRLRQ